MSRLKCPYENHGQDASQRTWVQSWRDFDWRAATAIIGVGSCALIFWLQTYFVTRPEFVAHIQAQSQDRLELRQDLQELKSDVKSLLRQSAQKNDTVAEARQPKG